MWLLDVVTFVPVATGRPCAETRVAAASSIQALPPPFTKLSCTSHPPHPPPPLPLPFSASKLALSPASPLPVVDLSRSAQLPAARNASGHTQNASGHTQEPVLRATRAHCLVMLPRSPDHVPSPGPAVLLPDESAMHHAMHHAKHQRRHHGSSQPVDVFNETRVMLQHRALRSPDKRQRQQHGQQQQHQQQSHIHTIFLSVPMSSQLRTAPPSTPSSPPPTAPACTTPLLQLTHDVRHSPQKALARPGGTPPSRVVRIPHVARPNRLAVCLFFS
jgi:hypothetical protein